MRDLASVYGRTGRIEAAVALLIEAVKRRPDSAALHAKLGYLYRYAGLSDASIAEYRRAQELAPDAANLIDTEDQIAKALIYLGDLAGARTAHRRVRSLAASGGVELDEKFAFYQGMVELYAGRREAAAAFFDASYAHDPSSIWSAFAQAYKAAATGDREGTLARAAALERRAVADGERRYRLVHLYALAGDRRKAVEQLGMAIDAGFFDANYIGSDRLLATLRALPSFGSLVSKARARQEKLCRLEDVPRCPPNRTSATRA